MRAIQLKIALLSSLCWDDKEFKKRGNLSLKSVQLLHFIRQQDLRRTSIFVQSEAQTVASSGVYRRVNEQRSEVCNEGMNKKTTFCVSPERMGRTVVGTTMPLRSLRQNPN